MRRYAAWVIRRRIWIIAIGGLLTLVFAAQASTLKFIINPARLAPQGHPYIKSADAIERIFGSKYFVIIGVAPKRGDIFQPGVLQTVERITKRLHATSSVVKTTLLSLSARQAKGIEGDADGFEARPLMERVPRTRNEFDKLGRAIADNPAYIDTIVSSDRRMAAILVELKDGGEGFHHMMIPVTQIVQEARSSDVEVLVSGNPVFLDLTEIYQERMFFLFPLALVVIGLLHYEAFRSGQGFILPLVTAMLAVIWGLGFMGAMHLPLDIFNAPTPILILAVAAGHAVQLLKRYYEEYARMQQSGTMTPYEASNAAVIQSLDSVGPVTLIAGSVAALGFFSLTVFEIETIRTFGVFTGLGILSAVVLEMTFIPSVRSLLPPPRGVARVGERHRVWNEIPQLLADWVLPRSRRVYFFAFLVAVCVFLAFGVARLEVDNSNKAYFDRSVPVHRDDARLNAALGGTNSLYMMIEGRAKDSMKDPAVLRAIEAIQRFAQSQPLIGKTLSLVDFVKRMNRAMHGDDPRFDHVPDTRQLISQYLLLYSISGQPGDFDSYVDDDYKSAKVIILLKTDANAPIRALIDKLAALAAKELGPENKVSFGGNAVQIIALTDVMVRDKILNVLQICAAVFVISALTFRSLAAGAIVLGPQLLAVLAVFGTMGWARIPLNIPNSLTAAMTVGIGTDYAIYLLYRLREELAKGGDMLTSLRGTLATAGTACLFVATAVAGGYGVLLFSFGYNIHIWLATFMIIAMIASVLTSLTLVPVVMLVFRPQFVFSRVKRRLSPGIAAGMLLGSISCLSVPTNSYAASVEEAAAIMEKSALATRTRSSTAHARFVFTSKSGSSRTRETYNVTKLEANGLDNMRMVRFLSPPDVKGTGTLLIERSDGDDDMWVYLPALKKVRRLVASNKRDSFVGTDFSYGDVIGQKEAQWKHVILREESVDGASCWVIDSVPGDETVAQNSGYSRRRTWVRKDNFVTIKIEGWDGAGELFKRALFSQVQAVGQDGNRWQPMHLEAENLQTGTKTIIEYEDYQAERNVSDDFFTPRYLETE